MMYFIERPNTWSAANKKWAEVHNYVDKFRNCLIVDDLSRDALINEIRHKVEELNEAYPRTKKLKVNFDFDGFISCRPDESHVDVYVFTIHIIPVRKTYRFAEQVAVLEKGGPQ